MRAVKLIFPDPNHPLVLLNNPDFVDEIKYLSPCLLDKHTLALIDPIAEHTMLDTEIIILSKFGRAINSILFENLRDSSETVEFINPIFGERKIGLVIDETRIVTMTEIED